MERGVQRFILYAFLIFFSANPIVMATEDETNNKCRRAASMEICRACNMLFFKKRGILEGTTECPKCNSQEIRDDSQLKNNAYLK